MDAASLLLSWLARWCLGLLRRAQLLRLLTNGLTAVLRAHGIPCVFVEETPDDEFAAVGPLFEDLLRADAPVIVDQEHGCR